MKLYKDPVQFYCGRLCESYHGRYKNTLIRLSQVGPMYAEPDNWYYTVNISSANHTYNSLWDKIQFKSLNSAKEHAMKLVDEYWKKEGKNK